MKISYIFLTLSLILYAACSEEKQLPKVIQGNAFGTTYSIQFYAGSNLSLEKGIDSIIYQINKSVNTYMPESDISKINQGDSSITVDKIFKDVFYISEEVFNNTNGYFDPTVGVLRNAYGFGDVSPVTEIDTLILDSLRRFVGFQKVKINSNNTITKKYPEIYFDFNAVAKGYGIDRIGVYLDSKGISNYIIELGGELLAKGKNLSKDTPWVVGLEDPDSEIDNRSYKHSVLLQDKAMASSGNYRKFRINPRTGKKYVHTIDPLTGYAVENDLTSATVIASSCAVADAYATAFMAMGLERSKEVLSRTPAIEAYFTHIDDNGKTQEFYTDGFSDVLDKK